MLHQDRTSLSEVKRLPDYWHTCTYCNNKDVSCPALRLCNVGPSGAKRTVAPNAYAAQYYKLRQ